MFTAILSAIAALAELPSALNALGDKINLIIAAIEQRNKDAWIAQVNNTIDTKLAAAKTREDFLNVSLELKKEIEGL